MVFLKNLTKFSSILKLIRKKKGLFNTEGYVYKSSYYMLFSKECMPKKCCQITFNILVIL